MPVWFDRIGYIEAVLINWMRANNLSITTPDDCMDELIRQGIYAEPLGKVRALAFRNDLRKLKDTYGMPYDTGSIRIEQEAEYQKWYIYLNNGR